MRIDNHVLVEAMREFELEQPVYISFRALVGKWGYYKPRDDNHIIYIHNRLPNIETANDVAWHELTHAMQAERHVKANGGTLAEFQKSYLVHNDNYYTNKYEIEARQMAIANASRKLVK